MEINSVFAKVQRENSTELTYIFGGQQEHIRNSFSKSILSFHIHHALSICLKNGPGDFERSIVVPVKKYVGPVFAAEGISSMLVKCDKKGKARVKQHISVIAHSENVTLKLVGR